jgi:hypothetical protein
LFIKTAPSGGSFLSLMSRLLRSLLTILAAPLIATHAPASLYRDPVPPERPLLSFRSVPLDESDPARRRLGRLLYLGGWAFRSNDGRFGGISAMHVGEGEVTALSDAGSILRFTLPGAGRPSLSITPLREGPGSPTVKRDRDTEAMLIRGRRAWITFERGNQIWRYSTRTWKSEASIAPPEMRRWSSNSGAEAMARLPDGRFLVFAEGRGSSQGGSEVLLFSGDPTAQGSRVRVLRNIGPEGYRVTDAAALRDGRLLILHRRVGVPNGVTAKLTLTDAPLGDDVEEIRSREIAHLQSPITVDNMEALSITIENGRTIVWLGSDDNFIPLQRTLLLKFALME